MYIDFILEPVVKTWLETDPNFVLVEDGDSGHGSGRTILYEDGRTSTG